MAQDPASADALGGIPGVRKCLVDSLKDATAADLNYSKEAVILDGATDPKKAIEVLLQNKVRAAPVQEKGKFIGVLDLRDMVKYALESYQKKGKNQITQKAMEWLAISPTKSTETLAYFARMRPFRCVKLSDSVTAVLIALAKGSHIVGVASNDGKKLVGVLTQGQLFQQIAKKWVFDADVKLSELAKAKYITSPVVSIRNTTKAYDAFDKMSTANLSGLAVVDENGKVIHNTSATDIKLWLIHNEALEATIETFLSNIRKMTVKESYPITVCGMKDDLKKAVGKLQATGYHRLWVVDDKGCPVGVLALTDVFKLIVEDHMAKEEDKGKDKDGKDKAKDDAKADK